MTENHSVSPGPGRPKDPAKREAILAAAQVLFLGNGYEGSSMEAIAAEAGVSKLTLYSHFKDKEALFSAAVKTTCETRLPRRLFQVESDCDIEKVLRVCAKHDVVVEINAHPWRLDLDWRWHQAALDFFVAVVDRHRVRDTTTSFLAATSFSGGLSTTQIRLQLLLQLSAGIHVEALVDRFVADPHR